MEHSRSGDTHLRFLLFLTVGENAQLAEVTVLVAGTAAHPGIIRSGVRRACRTSQHSNVRLNQHCNGMPLALYSGGSLNKRGGEKSTFLCPFPFRLKYAPCRRSPFVLPSCKFSPSLRAMESSTSALFHFPYRATPLFVTLTKTAGCTPTIPILVQHFCPDQVGERNRGEFCPWRKTQVL
jgi:hypothetical protein